MARPFFLALAILAAAAKPACGWPTVFPSGTTLYDPEKAYSGYLLFTPVGNGSDTLHLIDMNGHMAHEWKLPYSVLRARLLPTGNLLIVAYNPQEAPGRPGLAPFWMGGPGGVVAEMTWDGKIIYRHIDLNMHHDAIKLPNGNYLYLAWERVPPALQAKVRGGMKNSEHDEPRAVKAGAAEETSQPAGKVMFNDVLIEITPRNKIVWTWHANEHLDPEKDIIGPAYARQEWCHTNSVELLHNGNLLITSRTLDSILVIEKRTGKISFRWGNMTFLNEKTGELELQTGIDTLSGPHDGREIPPGLPGAGHFTVYDNGAIERGLLLSSRAVEIDPALGQLTWQSVKVVDNTLWDFGRNHFSHLMGSAQRLPNGNWLLCEGMNGRFFQITEKLELVWEYVSPFVADRRFNGAVFKVDGYAPDYCPQFQNLSPAKGAAVRQAAAGAEAQSSQVDPSASTMSNAALVGLAVFALFATAIAVLLRRRGSFVRANARKPVAEKTKSGSPRH